MEGHPLVNLELGIVPQLIRYAHVARSHHAAQYAKTAVVDLDTLRHERNQCTSICCMLCGCLQVEAGELTLGRIETQAQWRQQTR
jgi:hypothetical protein